MVKMPFFFHLSFFYLLGFKVGEGSSIQLLSLYDTVQISQAASSNANPIAVPVSPEDLTGVSRSILTADRWVRNHVLSYYPATRITTIVVGDPVTCQRNQEQNLDLILLSMRNLFHSLKWWGLEEQIKVSFAFSFDCFEKIAASSSYVDNEFVERSIKPLIEFILSQNSTFSLILPSDFSVSKDESLSFVTSHLDSMKKFGFFKLNKVNVVTPFPVWRKYKARKLIFVDSKPVEPNPLPEISQPPLHLSVGKRASPPLAHLASPPPISLPFAPELPSFVVPASSPNGLTLPPCNPVDSGAPAPEQHFLQKLWCVAKPSVPEETLQEAMDFACGQGGADCDEIMPNGGCYYPNTVVAHASYAFNSYWQKTKRDGGTCGFGGTAMLINSDPSFLHCRFPLS